MTLCGNDVIGATPVKVKWNVVRGDTATLRIDFLENDESTPIDISEWDMQATAYDLKTELFFDLEITTNNGWIVVTADSSTTESWGVGSRYRVNELNFDVQVTLADGSVWTPTVGVISVIADVTGGSL
jgi:hypothetical protein